MEAVLSRTDSGIYFCHAGGREVRGSLLHLAADAIVFEVYSPYPIAEAGDKLERVRIYQGGKTVYSGEATVRATLATGMTIIVTASPVGQWDTFKSLESGREFTPEARALIPDFGNTRPLLPEYQIAVSNIRAFLSEMSQWLAPLDLASAEAGRSTSQLQEGLAESLYGAVGPRLRELFAQYEDAFHRVPADEVAVHRAHAQRELHPLVLCAPLIHRSYVKPMGYAGDYGTVNLILANKIEGPNTYARVLNAFFTRIDICQGHRNRIEKLVDILQLEASRANLWNGRLRVLNLGCGPADEICRFIRRDELADRCDFTLLDFSSETIDHARSQIEAACRETGRRPGIEFVHQSISDLLKEVVRNGRVAAEPKYELAYCAGLFDYLSDRVCSKLMDLLHDWVVPGGRIVATNVHPGYRTHAILEDLAEWQLILRDQRQMLGLVPQKGGRATAETEPAGVNVFLDVQKPEDMNGFVRDTVQRRVSRKSLSGV